MTIQEAIAYGKRVIDLGLNDETQAFCELAIKSLEAWEKVKEEINSMPNIIYRWDAVEIIDKHLAEMESEK